MSRMTQSEVEAYQARDKRRVAGLQGVRGTSVAVERGTERRGRTSEVLHVCIPVPPSINDLYWTDKQGIRHMTSMGHKFKAHAVKEIQGCALIQGFTCAAGSAVKISVQLMFGRAGRDLDNCYKILQDSIAKALGFNDSRVNEIHMYRIEGFKGQSACSVEVELLVDGEG